MLKSMMLSKLGLAVALGLGSGLAFMPGLAASAHAATPADAANAQHHYKGEITAIDTAASTVTVTRHGTDHVLTVNNDSHLGLPPDMNASLSDFTVGERVRIGLVEGTNNVIRSLMGNTDGAKTLHKLHRHHEKA